MFSTLFVVEGSRKICVRKSPGLVLYPMTIKNGSAKAIWNFHFMCTIKNFTVLLTEVVIKKALMFVTTDSKVA